MEMLGEIPMAFRLDRRLALSLDGGGMGGISLPEVSVEEPSPKFGTLRDRHVCALIVSPDSGGGERLVEDFAAQRSG